MRDARDEQKLRPTPPGRRAMLRWLGAGCVAAAAAILALGAEPPEEGRRLFGLWRLGHALVAAALAWLAGAAVLAAVGARRLFVLLLATLMAVPTLGLLEVVCLTGVVDAAVAFDNRAIDDQVGRQRQPRVRLAGTARDDLAVRWGYDTPEVAFEYRTDRHGFRNAVDRDAADVYLLGDSFLVGGLVPAAELVGPRLEQALGVAVMQVALAGIGVQEEAALLRASGLPLQGRAVLHFVFEGNDLLDSARVRRGGDRSSPSWRERSFTYNLGLWLQRLTQPIAAEGPMRTGRIGERDYLFFWGRQSFAGLEGETEHVLATLGELQREVAALGGEYAVVLVPTKLRVLGPWCAWPPGSALADHVSHQGPLPARLRAWCEASRVPYLDLTVPLQEATARGAVPWRSADTHWNEIGHAVAAQAILEWQPFGPARWPAGSAVEPAPGSAAPPPARSKGGR